VLGIYFDHFVSISYIDGLRNSRDYTFCWEESDDHQIQFWEPHVPSAISHDKLPKQRPSCGIDYCPGLAHVPPSSIDDIVLLPIDIEGDSSLVVDLLFISVQIDGVCAGQKFYDGNFMKPWMQ
jgi:hypothetical protein